MECAEEDQERSWLRPPPWRERPGSPSSSSSREEPLPGPHCTSVPPVVAVARLLPLWARVVQAVPRSARSSGSCLLVGVDGADNRGVSRGLQSSQSSKDLSRADRRQFATLVVYRATSGGIALWGKSSSHSSQCSTRSSYRRIDGQVWSLTGLTSIEGDVNFKNLTAGFVDVYWGGSLNDNRVDANLCDLQDIGLPEGSSLTTFSFSLAQFSCPCFPTTSNGCRRLVGGSWNVSALLVGGTDASSRHWSPASPFPVPHSRGPRPGSLEVPGIGLRPCGPQFTAFIPLFLVCSVLGEFPTEPVTSEAHPYPPQVRARRTFLGRRPARSCVVAVQGQHLQQCSVKFEMADRRDWGGGGDDPEENTHRITERIWESLTDIRMRMDQQAPVPSVAIPPGDGETVPIAPVPPLPGVEVPFVAPLPPPPPVLVAEEPVMQIEKFLRLQPPTYSGGPNPDTTEHWVHDIERVFTTMRCPAADRVVLAAYQLRGFALEWWRLKMQTTFAGRIEETITCPEFLNVFNDTFFLIQVQQVKREQFRTLQQDLNCWN
ncbi:hypothetical protein Taro_025995 [Colocasia esculenta]|uniref:Retrotransposon gag domain-containing protein n=1 Tax=Colocasia esculenta TaxID=4460 RepID=A0A843VAS5_COLES|nr:hypothetical protein [Colocasia esculenta]